MTKYWCSVSTKLNPKDMLHNIINVLIKLLKVKFNYKRNVKTVRGSCSYLILLVIVLTTSKIKAKQTRGSVLR